MATEVIQHSASEQVDQLRRQLADDCMRKAQLDRDLAEVTARILANTNVLGGVELGRASVIEQAKKIEAEKKGKEP
jgi:hypothetical protein